MLIKHIHNYELLNQMDEGSKKLYDLVFTNIKCNWFGLYVT